MEATGINEVKNELGATLFPNPASDDVNMQFSLLQPSAMMMRVYDMDGRVVLSELQNLPGGANNLAIGVKDIAQGLYTVQLVNVTTQQSSVLKLEKQ